VEQEELEQHMAHENPPFRLRLPRLITDKEIGLGDVIKRITYAMGMESCGGCERRAAALNRRIAFSPRDGRRRG